MHLKQPTLYISIAGLLAVAACGSEVEPLNLGSRFLASALISSDSGGGFVVTESDSSEFAGVGIDVPAGALAEDTTVTVAPSSDLALEPDVQWVGPAMEFGPAGLNFSTPATVSLRVDSALEEDEPVVRVVSADGTAEWVEAASIVVHGDGTWSFPANHFTRFQPGRRRLAPQDDGCVTDVDCEEGAVCVAGAFCVEFIVDEQGSTIRDLAESAGIFTTLLQTIDGLDIAGLLSTPGSFTAFAPTDAAFSALPVNLSQVDRTIVQNIILNHVASGALDAATLTADGSVTTIAKITQPFTGTAVRGAAVSATDIVASNGIIHILDDVIIPPTTLEVAREAGFTELAQAIGSASAATQAAVDPDTLGGAGPITVFAPLNQAFQETNLAGEDLDAVLGLHVVAGQLTTADLTDGRVITTVSGGQLTVGTEGRIASLTDERGNTISILSADQRTLSGVLHVIDGVLLPASGN